MATEQQRAAPAALGPAPVGVGITGAPPAPAPDVSRTVMVIDGSYSYIGARKLPGGRIDFVRFREELERQAACRFRECWFFDHENVRYKSPSQAQSVQYTALKLAPPHGPQFQLKLYAMKKYSCHCRRCGHDFTQNVQKGVDNGIATKILSLAYENVCDRFILFAGDGDFYDSLNQIKNVLRKDLWVVGYRETVSADLQQLATRVIWLDDLWPAVQAIQQQSAPAPQASKAPVTLASEVHAPLSVEPSRPSRETGESSSTVRRVRLERQVHTDTDADSNAKSRGKTRNRRRYEQNRRNRSRSRSRSRSPRRQTTGTTAEGTGEDPPLYYIDTGPPKKDRQGSRATAKSSSPSQANANSKQERPDIDAGRRGKRKRHESPPLTFELSDMSSEEDEQHPLMQRGRTEPPSTLSGGITVINLASDSE